MKRFIGSLVLISLITAFIIVLLFALRLVFWDHLVSKALSLSDDVEVVCIGNSHTGCSWVESAEFKNKKIWHTVKDCMPYCFYHLIISLPPIYIRRGSGIRILPSS